MRISLDLDPATTASLLDALGLDAAALSEAEQHEALGLLARYAIDAFVAGGGVAALSSADATPTIEAPTPSELDAAERAAVEGELLALASGERGMEVSLDPRGVPTRVWLAEESRWVPLAEAPAGFLELEGHLAAVHQAMAMRTALRTIASKRLLATNEPFDEVVLGDIARPFTVLVDIGDRRLSFELAAEGAIVIGTPTDKPKLVPRKGR